MASSQPSSLYAPSTASDRTLSRDSQFTPPSALGDDSPRPAKRQRILEESPADPLDLGLGPAPADLDPVVDPAAAGKSRRVRTGCLTCRARHLKCDESWPSCFNCQKSNRACKRGVKLNFIDTQVGSADHVLPPEPDWKVQIVDESRAIASEYRGGLRRYAAVDRIITPPADHGIQMGRPSFPPSLSLAQADLQASAVRMPSAPFIDPALRPPPDPRPADSMGRRASHASTGSYLGGPSSATFSASEPAHESRDYLTSPDEVLFMQVFVEEVGLWMDSMDPMKHFSRLLPFHSLGEPMLLNAFLACGARHLTLVNPIYHEDKALYYYDTATTQLLRALQNPDRDTVICATTAVILNVYEIMSERAMQRMNHIAGARALIKECGWDARSTGIGAACFWLNVGMELLSCLHFNWQVAWDPDHWGLDMDFQRETESGREELWVHRMLNVIGKVANFRASIPRFQEASPHDEQLRRQQRFAEWQKLRDLCDSWNACVPRTMHPMAFLHPSQTSSKSAFPEVWLIKRATIVGRLFYHTAVCLLAQINPLMPKETDEMNAMMMSHAHYICGITAHVKDRGVASVALRSLAVAAECLVVRREQEEVLEIFEKISRETGWNVKFLNTELPEKWGWNADEHKQTALIPPPGSNAPAPYFSGAHAASTTTLPPVSVPAPPPTSTKPAIPSGILNPLLRTADFSLPNHPYQQYYQPPSQHSQYSTNFS